MRSLLLCCALLIAPVAVLAASGPDQYITGSGTTVTGAVQETLDGSGVPHPTSPSFPAPITGSVIAAPLNVTSSDKSVTILLGGAAQTMIPANAARHNYAVMNLSNDLCWLNDKGSNATPSAPSFPLYPNEYYSPPIGMAGLAAVSIYCPTTSDNVWGEES